MRLQNYKKIRVCAKKRGDFYKLFGVVKVGISGVGEGFCEEAAGGIAGCGEIHKAVVATVAGCGAGHFAFESGYEFHCAAHKVQNIAALEVALKKEIVACAATHRAPVYHAVAPFGVVAQEGGGQVLHGMEGLRRESRLAVGPRHADIESGDGVAGRGAVLAAYIYSRFEDFVINRETCYFFHLDFVLICEDNKFI